VTPDIGNRQAGALTDRREVGSAQGQTLDRGSLGFGRHEFELKLRGLEHAATLLTHNGGENRNARERFQGTPGGPAPRQRVSGASIDERYNDIHLGFQDGSDELWRNVEQGACYCITVARYDLDHFERCQAVHGDAS
jgi:hypothetical protein